MNLRKRNNFTLIQMLFSVALIGILCAALMPSIAQAQVTPQAPVIGVVACTNNVADNTTVTENLGSAIDCSRYSEVGLQVKFALNSTGTTACTFNFERSADGTNYQTGNTVSLSLAPSGTSAVCTNTTVTMGALPYIKLSGITAGNNSADMTNIAVVYVFKRDRADK